MSNASLPLRCKCRRKAVTSLRCSRCSVPICPDCSTVAPVGMLCSGCGNMRNAPVFQMDAGSTALAALATLAVAAVGGWLLSSIQFGIFNLLLAFLLGLAVAETAMRVTGRKRGPRMEALVGTCTALGILIGHVSSGAMIFDLWFAAMVVIGTISAVNRIKYI